MVRSPAAQSPKERILGTAARLFYRHGINSIGVEQIATEADTNKVTLYRHFPSKAELIAEWLRRTAVDSRAMGEATERNHPADGYDRLEALVDMAAAEITSWDRGCPFSNSLAELWDPNHAARKVIEDQFRFQRTWLERACMQAGFKSPAAVSDALYYLIRGTTVGLAIDSPAEFAQRERRAMLAILEGAKRR